MWVSGVGLGGKPEGRLNHPLGLKEQYYAFSMQHRQVQSTEKAKTAIRRSLITHGVLLMPLRGNN